MERERYIGVSGVLLKSDLYLTLGISGQIQHMVGGNGAKLLSQLTKIKTRPFSIMPIMVWWAISIRLFLPSSTS
ncbi:electron transfer flavoprotein subunit YdiR [Salmonella enterica subsp. enterica serovar Choleraesuis str. 0006]|nr:electron transfer flavoprotein subunit YdiR [Salmonella enterica subsp. enterica serovar Choleraesuis str. 0006]